MKLTTTHVLALLSIAELIVTGSMGYVLILWIGYGIYRILKEDL